MCNIDRQAETQLLAMGLDLIKTAMSAGLKSQIPSQSTDVLAAATTAYRAGKITKNQLMAVINALDEPNWAKNGTKPPTHPMVARLIRDAQLLQQ
jgi:hypothetical protein